MPLRVTELSQEMKKRRTTMSKCYSELIKLPTFKERYNYLKLSGQVGEMTFGGRRLLNQKLYRSREWKDVRRKIILRDEGCDLGIPGRELFDEIFIHHINPINENDILERRECLFDPENLICVSYQTHNAIHYGTEENLEKDYVPRSAGDTCLWRSLSYETENKKRKDKMEFKGRTCYGP